MNESSPELTLRNKIQAFVRAFGLLRSQTPCGKPISISSAHCLMVLNLAKEHLSQANLQKTLGVDKSNITRLCKNLEKDGFIVQRPSESDARVRLLSLTKKGERLANTLDVASRKRFSAILNQIPKDEFSLMCKSLDLLTSAIQKANMDPESLNIKK